MQKIASTGRRVGQAHHLARRDITDHEIKLCRQMHEEYPVGHPEHLGYKRLARIFEMPVRTIRRWLSYTDRR